jgi:hypothetical protein
VQSGKDIKSMLQHDCREHALKNLATILSQYMFDMGWFNSCLNCCDWNNNTEMCMKFKQRPPAKVIVSGCEHHSDIPF